MTVQSRKGSHGSSSGQANLKRNHSTSRLVQPEHVASTAGKKKSRSSANLVSMSTHGGGPSHKDAVGSQARPRKSAESAHKKRGSSTASLKHLAQEASGYGFTVAPTSRGKTRNKEKVAASDDAQSFSPEEADGWISAQTSDSESVAHTPDATTPPTSASTLASSHGQPKEQTAQAVQEALPLQPEPEVVTSPSQLATTPRASPLRKAVPAIQTHSPAVPEPQRPSQTKRKSSTTSTIAPSIRSISSFRTGPPTPRSMRQSASALVPVLDTNVTVKGTMAEEALVDFPQSTSPEGVQHTRPSGQHVRTISSASTRTDSGSDLARRLRQASGVSSSGSTSSGERKRTPSAGAEGLKSSASGYFGSLRNLAKSSASLVSMGRETSSPLASPATEAPPNSVTGVAIRRTTSSAHYGPSSRYKPSSAGSHPGFTPLISKFISPSDSSPIESYLPPPRRHPSTGGDVSPPHQPRQMACSRKLLMQKNAPLATQPYSGQKATLLPANMNNSSLNLAAKFAPLSSPQESSSEFHLNEPEEKLQQQQHKRAWGVAVMREAERVEKEHEAIKRWRDPVAESFQRCARI